MTRNQSMCTVDALQEFIDSPQIPEDRKPAMRAELAERLAPEVEVFGVLADGVLRWATLDSAAEVVARSDGSMQLVRVRGAVELLTITGESTIEVDGKQLRERTVATTNTFAQAGDLPA